KVWLLPYNTYRKAATSANEHVWYDELIISRNLIADPQGSLPPGNNPPGSNPPPAVNVLTLNLPGVLPLNATITAGVPSIWTVIHFDWEITPAGSQNIAQPPSPWRASAIGVVADGKPTGSAKGTLGSPIATSAPSMSLASQSLKPGPYIITVTAYNGSSV